MYECVCVYICAVLEGVREKGDPKRTVSPPSARRYGARSALVESIGRPGTGYTAKGGAARTQPGTCQAWKTPNPNAIVNRVGWEGKKGPRTAGNPASSIGAGQRMLDKDLCNAFAQRVRIGTGHSCHEDPIL